MMRLRLGVISVGALLLPLLLLAPAASEESPPRKSDVEINADAVVQSLSEEDEATLKELASGARGDPWLVADELIRRGAFDAAEAYAAATSSNVTEKLSDYVAAREANDDAADARAVLAIVSRRNSNKVRDYAGALAALEGVEIARRTVVGVLLLHERGIALWRLQRRAAAGRACREAGEAAGSLGWLSRAVKAFGHAGYMLSEAGEAQQAFAVYTAALPLARALGVPVQEGTVRANLGAAHRRREEFREALKYLRRAVKMLDALPRVQAQALHELGMTEQAVGNLPNALRYYDRSLALRIAENDAANAAAVRVDIGTVHTALGSYPRALAVLEKGLVEAEAAELVRNAAMAQMNIAGVYQAIGNLELSLEYAREALKRIEGKPGLAELEIALLLNVGLLHSDQGDHGQALAFNAKGITAAEAGGHKRLAANAFRNTGRVHGLSGDFDQALENYARALEIDEAIGDGIGQAMTIAQRGVVRLRKGERKVGLADLERSVREAYRLRARVLHVWCLGRIAAAHLQADEPGRAVYKAQEALQEVEHLLAGLGDENAAIAREKWAEVFDIGALAAARLDEPARAFTFIESGRAGALLEMLGGRLALRWGDIPSELREAEADAKAHVQHARGAYRAAVAARDRKRTRETGRALQVANDAMAKVVARIQSKAKGQAASLYYPRAKTLEAVQFWLEDDEALVLYAVCLDEAIALVVTPDTERILSLGAVDDVTKACDALEPSDPGKTCTAALAALRKKLVAPLELGEHVKRVIVSPDGPINYVPFGAVFDRAVSCAPSGTTHALLMEEGHEVDGVGVLAVGDPDYQGRTDAASSVYVRGRKLAPLEASREEAKDVGAGEGNEVLLGPDANEERLREALGTRTRWRAVHLACHGIVDPERPRLSSLVLSRSPNEDGFLTAQEVLRMDVPADLAVLSACDTGKGRIVKGEGIVGLTRAFMYAGAPRVLCSLWKVEDKATQALMAKFYALWNPTEGEGLSAAEALKQAQDFVRGHDQWQHPYYWAAWVLWGLPG